MAYFPKSKHKPIMKGKEKPWGENQKFYKRVNWNKLRTLQLTTEPLCRKCKQKGLTVPATVADHIIPIEQGGERYDLDNLQSLCESCHNRKSAKEGRRHEKSK
jgi:5-methylcytosine-specific restriction endonuclease McrA